MITDLDTKLFLFLNSIHSPFFDDVMWIASAKITWVPFYLLIVWLLYRYTGRKAIVIVLFIIAAITVSDQSSVHLFKNVFQRLRPCHEPDLAGLVYIVRDRCGGLYGFVSSHASNTFTLATLISLIIKNRWMTTTMVIWAVFVSYSRIYLGVHYPGDIAGGALLGVVIGYGVYYVYTITDSRLLQRYAWFKTQ